ncbi:MAG: hypothetical protein Q7T34_00240 [Candidatus Parcubacteria bacterium]|nr:hypothetical protein [Candidatus Parcubacteria bacterium]
MNKKALFALITFLALPVFVFAQTPSGNVLPSTAASLPTISFQSGLTSLTNWLFTLVLAVATVCILISAFYFITAQGDAEKVKSARDFLLYALVGIIVALMARGLVSFISGITG